MFLAGYKGSAARAGVGIASAMLLALPAAHAVDPTQAASADARAWPAEIETIVVTARLRREDAQEVPVSMSVVDGRMLDATGTYNTSAVTQLVPGLSYNSPNPRNTSFTIRGLGSSVVAIAQSNDGLEPGVGFYVDQVYHARPATAAFDFLDTERIEVLRGPQGTVFGKNTTAGAINIVSRAPSFDPEGNAEISGGNIGHLQAKASLSGPIAGDQIAGRLSFAATRRNGVIDNVTTGARNNNVGNTAVKGQLLFAPTDSFHFRLIADYSSFDSNCCTQVYIRVGATLKAAAQQYPALAAGQSYTPASLNPFDRKTDIDAALKVDTNEGGVAGIADWDIGPATLTAVSAWRFWNWDAANDRDYTRLSIQTLQHIPSRQDQYSQELRVASNGANTIDYVAGLYWFSQTITGEPITQYGPLAAYWLLGPPPVVPGNLLDGYFTDGHTHFVSRSYAAFGEATWRVADRLNVTGGLRYTYEDKDGSYESTVGGGLATTDTALINRKLSILRSQSYTAAVNDGSASGRASVSYMATDDIMAYATYARGSKSGGINMSGLPLNAANLPALATAVVRPEKNTTWEAGVKSAFLEKRLQVNIDAFQTTVRDFQTNVVDTGPGALRGYLANIEKVRVKGIELDSAAVVTDHLTLRASSTWSDGRYISYVNGPCPLELIAAATTVCNLSGRPLSALSRWVWSAGAEYAQGIRLAGYGGEAYLHVDVTGRNKFYGDPSDSKYTGIDGYTLVNASLGFRLGGRWDLSVWVKNLFDKDHIQNLTIQAGNSGLILGTPSDPRLAGVTLRAKI